MYYKVCRAKEDKLYSAIGPSYFDSDYNYISSEIEYVVGKFIYPKIPGSNLMVFENLIDARNFNFPNDSLIIFECEVKSPSKSGLFFGRYGDFRDNFLQAAANIYRNKECHRMTKDDIGGMPSGTVFCEAVKLIRKVM